MLPDTMSRRLKGRVAPPPRLAGVAQRVAEAVLALPGVSAQAHWEIGSQTEVDGTDFYVGEEELGHIHLDGEAHIPIGRVLASALVRAKLAQPFPWSREFVVVDTRAGATAQRVFELRHAQIFGATEDELRGRLATVPRGTQARSSRTSTATSSSVSPRPGR